MINLGSTQGLGKGAESSQVHRGLEVDPREGASFPSEALQRV